MALLKRLRGDQQAAQAAGGKAQQMKMLRRLPKLLRFIPGTAQDVRAYFLTLQYWLAGSEENIANMVRLLVDRYADGPRRALARHASRPRRRVEYPESASTTRACRAASPTAIDTLPARRATSAAPSGCCCCARTCWPATPAITTA